MPNGGIQQANAGLSVLLVDSNPEFLSESCELIAEHGHRAWGARDLIAAVSFLTDQTPDLMLVELALLEMDGADPLGDLRAHAPGTPTILMAPGPPDERLQAFCQRHDIYGYHDKEHGSACLLLWVSAALMAARHLEAIRHMRLGLRKLLDAVPQLHQIQSPNEVLESILGQIDTLVGGQSAFVAARVTDPVGKPPIEGFASTPPSIDDYVVGAASGYPLGVTVDKLKSIPLQIVRRAMEESSNIIDDSHAVLPLALGEQVLGLAYLKGPGADERDFELLQLYASHAASAIRSAVLYELATVDETARVFRKSFTLERLRETVKLAWRKSFPVTVLMTDIDAFKKLNDRHGHVVGDRALRHLGRVLKACVRDSDIVGRFGGDEFLLVLIDADRDGADVVADRLAEALKRERGPLPEGAPSVQMSMGMATLVPGEPLPEESGFPDFEKVVESLVAEADAAMYLARREKKGCVAGATFSWQDFARR